MVELLVALAVLALLIWIIRALGGGTALIAIAVIVVLLAWLGVISISADASPGKQQGSSQSCPDQDGKGTDKGKDEGPGCDKPGTPGEDRDGNNGTGNDSDCEDDNNGKPRDCADKPGTPDRPEPSTVSTPRGSSGSSGSVSRTAGSDTVLVGEPLAQTGLISNLLRTLLVIALVLIIVGAIMGWRFRGPRE